MRKASSFDAEGVINCPDSPASQKLLTTQALFDDKYSLYGDKNN